MFALASGLDPAPRRTWEDAMAIGELCSRVVVHIRRNETVAEAAGLMRKHGVGCVVVTEGSGEWLKPVGLLTDRDVAVGVVATGLDPLATPVDSVMARRVILLEESEGVGRAIQLMRASGVHRLPVVDESGRLVGLLSADDLFDVIAEEMHGLAGMHASAIQRERVAFKE
jgi:CBS domain-containing protein